MADNYVFKNKSGNCEKIFYHKKTNYHVRYFKTMIKSTYPFNISQFYCNKVFSTKQ